MHVVLGVAGVHAQGVQFHQLTRVVLVDAAHVALRLVQKIQHCGMARAGQQQVFESAQCIGAYRVDGVMANKRPYRALAGENIQVVKPELCHLGEQRVFNAGIAACQQAPGRCALLHLAAKAQSVRGVVDHLCRLDRTGGRLVVHRLLSDCTPCRLLCAEVAYGVAQGLVKACEVGRYGGRKLAGGLRGVNLLKSPGFGVSVRCLGAGCSRPIAESRCRTPAGGQLGIGLRLSLGHGLWTRQQGRCRCKYRQCCRCR